MEESDRMKSGITKLIRTVLGTSRIYSVTTVHNNPNSEARMKQVTHQCVNSSVTLTGKMNAIIASTCFNSIQSFHDHFNLARNNFGNIACAYSNEIKILVGS